MVHQQAPDSGASHRGVVLAEQELHAEAVACFPDQGCRLVAEVQSAAVADVEALVFEHLKDCGRAGCPDSHLHDPGPAQYGSRLWDGPPLADGFRCCSPG